MGIRLISWVPDAGEEGQHEEPRDLGPAPQALGEHRDRVHDGAEGREAVVDHEEAEDERPLHELPESPDPSARPELGEGPLELVAVLRGPPRHQRDEPAEVALADPWVHDEQSEDPPDQEGVTVVEGDAEPVQVGLGGVDVLGDGPLQVDPGREEGDDDGEDPDEHPYRPRPERDGRAGLLFAHRRPSVLQTDGEREWGALYALCAPSLGAVA